jgi:hypothetical protein
MKCDCEIILVPFMANPTIGHGGKMRAEFLLDMVPRIFLLPLTSALLAKSFRIKTLGRSTAATTV